jgi:hypothetical protein
MVTNSVCVYPKIPFLLLYVSYHFLSFVLILGASQAHEMHPQQHPTHAPSHTHHEGHHDGAGHFVSHSNNFFVRTLENFHHRNDA